MEQPQPCTPPANSSAPPAETPEYGALAPLTIHEIASWTYHDWTMEPLRRINEAEEQCWVLLEQVSPSGDENLVRRIHQLIDWIQDCFMDIALPDFPVRVNTITEV